ncbi:MAG: mannitol dehydrogenase, partial [Ramlibacter sp.]|nr:mannitol dehydrogenase [Ramlibacter sp.]
ETQEALEPQRGLYTVAIRDADAGGRPRESLQVVGNLIELLVAPRDPAAVVARIAHPDVRIVSLTITEKGYARDPLSGGLQSDDPDIAHDLLHASAPRSAIGVIVRGLQARRSRGLPPVTLMSLDNLPGNGDVLRTLVLQFAGRVDPQLCEWIAADCSFPNSMVDRIVPRTTDADRAAIGARLGCADGWPVIGEPFFDWAVEDRFVAGRPEWQVGGASFVTEAKPFELLKLRMVNGAHSTLAYMGVMAGCATVDRAVAEPHLRTALDRLLRDEIAPTLPALPGLDLDRYRDRLLTRFANPALKHATQQIAMDGSQKLPPRLLGTVRDRLHSGLPITRLALSVAAWLYYLGGVDEAGQPFIIEDPLKKELADLLMRAELSAAAAGADAEQAQRLRVRTLIGFEPVFGDLGSNPAFVAVVGRHLQSLRQHGVISTLRAIA